jgi:hypothetical protein
MKFLLIRDVQHIQHKLLYNRFYFMIISLKLMKISDYGRDYKKGEREIEKYKYHGNFIKI